jgi:hypothetical protein
MSTRDGFYEISDRYNWVLGETLERALQALRRELEKESPAGEILGFNPKGDR